MLHESPEMEHSYIGDGTMQYFYDIIIALGITIVVAAVMTVILSRFFEKKNA